MTTHAFVQSDRHGGWLVFGPPERVIRADRISEVLPALEEIERSVNTRTLWAVGFVSYEAASAFDPAFLTHAPGQVPLLWFGLHAPPIRQPEVPLPVSPTIPHYAWQPSDDKARYDECIRAIKGLIAAGDTYQVNHTLRLRAQLAESAQALFARMVEANRPRYSAYVDTGPLVVSSASPELFFHWDGDAVISKPMKGTTGRGLWQVDDESRAARLAQSVKDRAENLMIVDMVRNDLGRIARTGSVKVTHLFDIERYPTLWQMTSIVRAETGAGFVEIMRALFPAASITGAPKARATQIIAQLESTPRGVYTGCVGYLAPGRQAQFNVAIRTAVIDRARGEMEYGCGGGIVWDSTSSAEYAECLLKARIVTDAPPPFELLETLLWEPGSGYFLLEGHLARLRASADYLDVPFDVADVRDALHAAIAPQTTHAQRVRLLVDRGGKWSITSQQMAANAATPVRLAIARRPVRRGNPFVYHKTTHRKVYDEALREVEYVPTDGVACGAARGTAPRFDDVVLWNESGEVTESTIANIVIEHAGRLITPPVRCGLLAGVYRHWLLEANEIAEQPFTLDMLRAASAIFLINSVRKWRRAVLVQVPDAGPDLTAAPLDDGRK